MFRSFGNGSNASGNSSSLGCGGDTGVPCLGSADLAVVILYFIILLTIAFWPSIKGLVNRCTNKAAPPPKESDVADFFLAGREMGAWAVAASLFSSNIGSEHFIGLAGSGASTGLAVGGFEWSAGIMLMMLGWGFFPAFFRSGVMTTPQWIQDRMGGKRIRMVIAVVSLVLYCFTKVSATLYAGGIILKTLLGWDIYVSSAVLILSTGAYVALGGLRVVVYTEVFQTIALVLGGIIMTFYSFTRVGGWSGLKATLANASTAYPDVEAVPEHYFHVMRPTDDKEFPWTGMVFGIFASSIWYWCTDQVIVQRVLSARTEADGRKGCIIAAMLKILPPFMMVVPGMVCRALFPRELNLPEGADTAYPLLVVKLLPPGLVGFVVASMLAALMSSLASVFNSSSTLFTLEIWQVARPAAGETELVRVGRMTVLAMCVVGMAWLPIVNNAQQLFVYIQSVSNYLSPPITVIFLIALFVKNARPLEPAAFFSMMVGFTLGLARLICHIAYGTNDEGKGTVFTTMNFMHFGLMVLAITFIAFGLAVCWTRRFSMLHANDRYNYAVAGGGGAAGVGSVGGAGKGGGGDFLNPLVGAGAAGAAGSGSSGGVDGDGAGGNHSSSSSSSSSKDVIQGVPTRSGGVTISGTTELLLDGRRSISPRPRNPTTNDGSSGSDGGNASFVSPATYPAAGSGGGSGSGEMKAGDGAEVEIVGWSALCQHMKEEHRSHPWHGAFSALTVAVVLGMYIGFG